MRPVLIGDVLALARALQPICPEDREAICRKWLHQAEAADKYRKRFGRLHPTWGNGSLMGRALVNGEICLAGPCFQDPEFCECFRVVLQGLAHWRRQKLSN